MRFRFCLQTVDVATWRLEQTSFSYLLLFADGNAGAPTCSYKLNALSPEPLQKLLAHNLH